MHHFEGYTRLNQRLKWKPGDFTDYLEMLAVQAQLVDPEALEDDAARDANDVPVLGTLLAAKADYLITGDDDLGGDAATALRRRQKRGRLGRTRHAGGCGRETPAGSSLSGVAGFTKTH